MSSWKANCVALVGDDLAGAVMRVLGRRWRGARRARRSPRHLIPSQIIGISARSVNEPGLGDRARRGMCVRGGPSGPAVQPRTTSSARGRAAHVGDRASPRRHSSVGRGPGSGCRFASVERRLAAGRVPMSPRIGPDGSFGTPDVGRAVIFSSGVSDESPRASSMRPRMRPRQPPRVGGGTAARGHDRDRLEAEQHEPGQG
jgi:hypothetical protein